VRRLALSLLAVLALAAAAGCGQAADSAGDFSGEEKKVAQVIEDLQDAATKDEPRRICNALLAPQAKARVKDCLGAMRQALDDADNYDLTVKDVTIDGATARARVAAGRDEDQMETIELVRVGSDWRISALAGR